MALAKQRRASEESNYLSPESLGRLKTARDHSRRRLEVFRDNRTELWRAIVGKHYSENGHKLSQPLPLLRLALDVISRLVAAHNPKVNCTTFIPQWRSKAFELKLALNYLIDRLGLRDTIQDVFRDSLVSSGMVKVGMSRGASYEYEGSNYSQGVPFVDRVDLDDMEIDMNAKRVGHVQFIGNRYDAPLDWIKSAAHFDKQAREEVGSQEGMSGIGDNEIKNIGRGDYSGEEEFEERAMLVDLFLPRYGVILSFPDDDGSWTKPLDVVKWKGPPCGPYYMLGLDRVPNNVMPLGPLVTLRDVSEAANQCARKIIRQAQRQKTVVGVQGGATEDGNRLMKAGDGEMIRIDNPASSKEFNYGGPNQMVVGVMLQLQDLFDRYGGNISALGGLSPQAATLGQDELLSGSASKQIEDYRAKLVNFTRDICYALAWHVWHDPTMELNLSRSIDIPGAAPIDIPFRWGPLQRQGDFLRFNLEIEPYSMQYSSPGQKAQALMQILTGVVIPTLPMAQQQGGQLDYQRVLQILGEYSGLPELTEVMTFMNPGGGVGDRKEMGDEMPMKPNVSHRTYERVGRPGQPAAGGGANMMQQLMASGNQQAAKMMTSNGA